MRLAVNGSPMVVERWVRAAWQAGKVYILAGIELMMVICPLTKVYLSVCCGVYLLIRVNNKFSSTI